MTFKRIYKYTLLGIAGLTIILVAGGFVIRYLYKDKIIAVITSEINKHLATKIDVKSISFSVFSHFPQASVQFNDVVIYSASGFNQKDFVDYQTDTLLYAKTFSLGFNLFDLLRKQYVFERISITEGKITLLVDHEGYNNFSILDTSKSSQNSSVAIKLNRIDLTNMTFYFCNTGTQVCANAMLYETRLSGNFYKSDYRLAVDSRFLLNELSESSTTLVDYRNITLKTVLTHQNNTFTITNGQLFIDELPFTINGTIAQVPELQLQLAATGNHVDIAKLLSLLPASWQEKASDYDISGLLSINASVEGIVNYKTLPAINVQFSVKQGRVIYRPTQITLNRLSLTGQFTNGIHHSAKTSTLKIDSFYTAIEQSTLSGYFHLHNLIHPYFETKMQMKADLQSIAEFTLPDSIETLSGNLSGTLNMSGTLKQLDSLTTQMFSTLKNKSRFILKNGSFKLKHHKDIYQNINGDIYFNNQNAIIDSLHFTYNHRPVSISGRIYHYLSLLANKHKTFESDLAIKTSYLDVNAFLQSFSSNGQAGSDKQIDLDTRFRLLIDSVDYDRLHLSHFQADGLLKKHSVHINRFSFISLEGETEGSLDFLDFPTEKTLHISSYLKHINIHSLFSAFRNFGQTFITQENLNGYLTTNVSFAAALDTSYHIVPASIVSNAHVVINDGKLIQFEPMEKLSKFTKVNDLSNIQFQTLSNDIFIENSRIIVPEMKIVSDQFSIDLSGTHQFSGEYEYHLHVILSEWLSKQQSNNEFGIIEKNTNTTSLYLVLSGTPNQSKIRYDTKATGRHIKQRLKEEKETLKQILKEEFGRKKKPSKIKSKKKNESTEGGWIFE